MRFWLIVMIGLLGWIGHSPVHARAQRPDIKVDLLVGGHVPEEPGVVWLGVRVKLGAHWKTYWRSPGDSGFASGFDWSASDNLVTAETLWPAPRRMEILGVETIGYTKEVVFPIKAQVADPAKRSGISLALALYACTTMCVRDDHKLTATVLPGETDTESQALIDHWRARVPSTSSDVLSITSLRLTEDAPPLLEATAKSTRPFGAPDLFVESDPAVFGSKPRVDYDPDGTARFTVPLAGDNSHDLRRRSLKVTLVDGEAAVEASVGGNAGVSISHAGSAAQSKWALWRTLAVALAGGFILNLMPCVFPVLSLKLLAFVTEARRPTKAVRAGFAASAAGIVASFLVLASAMVSLKALGATVGWGIQFQQPLFLIPMSMVLALFAANLLGLFEVALPRGLADRFNEVGRGSTLASHFGGGFVATLLATPCSAPLVGTAVGFALAGGAREIYLVFVALGLGMALPYLLVVLSPRILTLLPRPGRWMLVVKQAMALALLATSAWLLAIVGMIAGALTAWIVAALLAFVLAGLWLRRNASSTLKALSIGLIVTPVALLTAASLVRISVTTSPAVEAVTWRRFDEKTISSLVGEGRTVLVDITAAWCVTCKINKALVLDDTVVVARLRSEVVPVRGD